MNKNQITKVIFFAVIPAILLMFWIGAAVVLNNKISFSILLTKEPSSNLSLETSGNESRLRGTIQASNNGFGLIMLGFNVYAKHPGDILTFRIREKGTMSWQSSSSYRADWLNPNELFPMGFKVYPDSKGKMYEFEVYSPGDKVVVNDQGLFSGYKFTKDQLKASKTALVNYFVRKALTNIQNFNFFLSSLTYMVPFVAYMFILFSFRSWKRTRSKRAVLIAFFAVVLTDIFILPTMYFGLTLIISIALIFVALKADVSRRTFFYLFIVFTIVWIGGVLLNKNDFEEKINFWAYAFLFTGVLMTAIEEKRSG